MKVFEFHSYGWLLKNSRRPEMITIIAANSRRNAEIIFQDNFPDNDGFVVYEKSDEGIITTY